MNKEHRFRNNTKNDDN